MYGCLLQAMEWARYLVTYYHRRVISQAHGPHPSWSIPSCGVTITTHECHFVAMLTVGTIKESYELPIAKCIVQ